MDESRLLGRLERIGALDRGGAPAGTVLTELRGLLREAEEQTRREAAVAGDGREVAGASGRRRLGT